MLFRMIRGVLFHQKGKMLLIAVTIALLLQALLFGDGGILAFGANCFNMAFVLPFVGHAVYHAVNKAIKAPSGKYIAAGVGAYVGINAAALCAAIEFGIQPHSTTMLSSSASRTSSSAAGISSGDSRHSMVTLSAP